ncbi:MAG: molybdopterin-dependent oxidoreductase [Pirellulaceae bacterium]|nr:molybdopterin-dependent oxidoreductase [Planctomycetales bacterium]
MPDLERIVAARMQLRERFLKQMENTPSITDDSPQGTGPINRHGMPQLPVGQTITQKWPVLDLGITPEISLQAWQLVVDGAVEQPLRLGWNEFLALEQVEDVSDFHCVTTWSRLDLAWHGVRLIDLLALARPVSNALAVMCHAHDGYTTNVLLEEALKPDVLLVHTANGEPLAVEHGGPVRMITPQLYAWKGAKWISRIEVLTDNRPGFWEQRGYSNSAYPWRNDRYD